MTQTKMCISVPANLVHKPCCEADEVAAAQLEMVRFDSGWAILEVRRESCSTVSSLGYGK